MRPAQRRYQTKRVIPNRRKVNDLTVIAKPLVYGCELPPVDKLAHKLLRTLKHLVSGYYAVLRGATYYWQQGDKLFGKVRIGQLHALRQMNLAYCLGGVWLPTKEGHKAVA